MDYLVGTSPRESEGSANSTLQQANNGGAATPVAPPPPGAQHSYDYINANPGNADMFDLSSFDPLQSHVLDQLTAASGLTLPGNVGSAAQGVQQQDLHQQQQQQYYLQQVAGAFAQPATAALQTAGQQPAASVVSMDASSTCSAQPQQYIPFDPSQVLSAQGVPSATLPGFSASVVSASTFGDKDDEEFAKKRPHNWGRMSTEEKRRWERNMREQERSHKISSQIKELRTLLTESNVPFKPNKYSILLSVAEYIKQLQSRAIMVDAEHRKLIDTIRQTSEMVNAGQAPEPEALPAPLGKETQGTNLSSEADMLFVQGLDYMAVFEQCPAPMGIAALDGRILACNNEFQSILGYPREELLKHSLFTVMQNHEEVYKAMGGMLKADDITLDSDLAGTVKEEKPPLYWSGVVGQTKQNQLCANITLTRSSDGSPKFFNCALMIK